VRASNEEEARMNVRYRVDLSQTERAKLTALLSGGKNAARKLKRAQILLAADAGASEGDHGQCWRWWVHVYRTKRRFVLGNLEAALSEEPRPGASRKLSGKDEARLIATACSSPPAAAPAGAAGSELVRRTVHPTSHARRCAALWPKTTSSHGARTCGAFRRWMANTSPGLGGVLDLYAEEPDPKPPVVCFDESPTQLIAEVRLPIPAEQGQLERYDCEYKRNGTANLFIFLDVHRPGAR
jgi:hypothetical protein